MAVTEGNHQKKVMEKLAAFREEEFLTDVILTAGETHIPAHRNVLSSCSEYFRAMFSQSYKEALSKEVPIQNIDGKTLQEVVNYCYTGVVKASDHDMAVSLLDAADFFDLPEVKPACISFLKDNVTAPKSLELLSVAERHKLQHLRDDAFQTVLMNFNEVRHSEDFLHLSAGQLSEILQVDRDLLSIDSERDAFEALMDWYGHDRKNRRANLPPLLAFIKLPPLPPTVVLKILSDEPLDSTEMLQLISECDWPPKKSQGSRLVGVSIKVEGDDITLQWLTFDESRGTWVDGAARRIEHPKKGATGVGYQVLVGHSVLYLACGEHIFTYVLKNSEWHYRNEGRGYTGRRRRGGKAAFPVEMGAAAGKLLLLSSIFQRSINCVGDSLYIAGGTRHLLKEIPHLVKMEADDFSKVVRKADMRFARRRLALGVVGNKLYAVGGATGAWLSCVERYDPSADAWTTCQPTPYPMEFPTVAPLNGFLYCIGFKNEGGEQVLRALRYEPSRDEWVEIPHPLHPLVTKSMCNLNDELVLTGIHRETPRIVVIVYNPNKNAWREIPAPSAELLNFRVFNLPEDPEARDKWLNFIQG